MFKIIIRGASDGVKKCKEAKGYFFETVVIIITFINFDHNLITTHPTSLCALCVYPVASIKCSPQCRLYMSASLYDPEFNLYVSLTIPKQYLIR